MFGWTKKPKPELTKINNDKAKKNVAGSTVILRLQKSVFIAAENIV